MEITKILVAVYEFVGAKYPVISLVMITLLGGFLAGGVWSFAKFQYEKIERTKASTKPAEPGGKSLDANKPDDPAHGKKSLHKSASRRSIEQHSSGDNSPNIIGGDGSTIRINPDKP